MQVSNEPGLMGEEGYNEVDAAPAMETYEDATTYGSFDEFWDTQMKKNMGVGTDGKGTTEPVTPVDAGKKDDKPKEWWEELQEVAEVEGKPEDKVNGEAEAEVKNPEKIDFKEYKYEDQYGNKLDIKSKKQLDTIVAKGIYAGQVYNQMKDMQTQLNEAKESIAAFNNFEQELKENPAAVMSEILWEMDRDAQTKFVLEWAERLQKPEDAIVQEKKLLEYERLQKKAEYEARVNAEREKAEQEQYAKQTEEIVDNWVTTTENKWKERLPEKLHGFVAQQVDFVLTKINNKLTNGEDVKLSEMTKMFEDSMKSLLGAVGSKEVRSQVGKQVEKNKQVATAKIQTAASGVVPNANTSKRPDPVASLDSLIRGVRAGSVKITN